MSNASAKKRASVIRSEFWIEYERALEPKACSKAAYLEELEELASDAELRIDCVRNELKGEE